MASHRLLDQYLTEALATERALITTLSAHMAMTPRGDYRDLLERHLRETRGHAAALDRRIGPQGDLIGATIGLAETVVGQVLSLAKAPFDLLRGGNLEEKLLKNAKDECATEALEIATYDAIEAVATALGDRETAALAAAHRADEERMLADLRELIPALAGVTAASRAGDAAPAPAGTTVVSGAGETAPAPAGTTVVSGAGDAAPAPAGTTVVSGAGETAPAPAGASRAGGGEDVADATGDDAMPIADYDELNAGQIVARLGELTQSQLATALAYERAHRNRRTIVERARALTAEEPWPGYDRAEATAVLAGINASTASAVRDYESRHRRRVAVLEAAQNALSRS